MKKFFLSLLAVTLTAVAYAFPQYTSAPENMSEVTDFEQMVLTFPEGTELEVTDDSGFYFEDPSYVEDDVDITATIEDNKLILTPASALMPNKWWALVIEGDCLDADGDSNPDIYIRFKVMNGGNTPVFPEYTVDPSNIKVTGLDKVSFTFPEGTELAATSSTEKATLKVMFGTLNEGEMTINDNVVSFSFSGVEEGLNSFKVPAGIYTANDVANPAYESAYNVTLPFPDYDIDPGRASVDNLDVVTLTFAEGTKLQAGSSTSKATLTVGENSINGTMSIEGSVVSFNFVNVPNGNVELDIPEGIFTANGVANPYIYKTFILKQKFPEYTSSPENFATVEDFKEAVFTFPAGTTLNVKNTEEIYFEDTSYVEDDVEVTVRVEDNVLIFTPQSELAPDTWWGLYIESGSFTANGIDNGEIYIRFKPVGGSQNVFPQYKLDPSYSLVESLKDVTFTFEEGTVLAATSSTEKATMKSLGGTDIEGVMTINNNVVTFTFEGVESGLNIMDIPAGIYTANGINNPALQTNYNVRIPFPVYTTWPTEDATVETLENINISFNDGIELELTAAAAGIALDKIEGNPDSEDVKETSIAVTSEVEGSDIIITPVTAIEKGTYRMYVPMNAITANGISNSNVIIFSFNVSKGSGLNDLTIDNADVTVFDMNGIVVFKGKAADMRNALKGMYIVNGKKIIF